MNSNGSSLNGDQDRRPESEATRLDVAAEDGIQQALDELILVDQEASNQETVDDHMVYYLLVLNHLMQK